LLFFNGLQERVTNMLQKRIYHILWWKLQDQCS